MAIVKKYPARVVAIRMPIKGVYTLEMESLDKPFKYDPGQFLHVAIDEYDPAGQWPESRCFSMQSSPAEHLIRLTYAVKGRFTKRMEQELKQGSLVTLKLPYGDLFTQSHNKGHSVFIAGGTGITPFLSLFTHASFDEYTRPCIYLGFRSEEYNIYKEELDHSFNSSKIMKLFYENTNGILDITGILNENGPLCDYFISGPPAMIKSFKQSLVLKGVPVTQVLTDDWE